MKKTLILSVLLLELVFGAAAQTPVGASPARPAAAGGAGTEARNRQVVNEFFVALETQQFGKLREVFAPDGRQVNAFVPEGFPKSFEGSAEIYQQYSALPKQFGQMRFPRTIYATEDPNLFFVKFHGDLDLVAGGKYQNDYIGMFRLRDGRVVEYTEYLNPILLAKAFNIPLK